MGGWGSKAINFFCPFLVQKAFDENRARGLRLSGAFFLLNSRRYQVCPGEPAAVWPNLWGWSTGPPHFHPLDATGSTAQASRRRFGPTLETGQQGLLTFIFRAPCSPRWHCFEEVSFFRVSFHSFRQKRDSPSEWLYLLRCKPKSECFF